MDKKRSALLAVLVAWHSSTFSNVLAWSPETFDWWFNWSNYPNENVLYTAHKVSIYPVQNDCGYYAYSNFFYYPPHYIGGYSNTADEAVQTSVLGLQRSLRLIATITGAGSRPYLMIERRVHNGCSLYDVYGQIRRRDFSAAQDNADSEKGCPAHVAPTLGNPISVGTGNKKQVERDLTSDSLSFNRQYNSETAGSLDLSPGWSHEYAKHLVLGSGSAPNEITATRPNGAAFRFTRQNGLWASSAPSLALLSESNGGYLLVLPRAGLLEWYDASGQLGIVADLRGGRWTVAHSADRSIVTDQFGRQMTLFRNGDKLDRVELSPDVWVRYRYAETVGDGLSRLSEAEFSDGSRRTYEYGDERFPFAMTRLRNERGNASSWTYDARLNAVSSQLGNGIDRYVINRTSATDVTVTDPLGSVSQLTFTPINGRAAMVSASQPAGSGCNAAATSVTYDDNANITSRTLFNGSKSCYAYDTTRNVEMSRVEGLVATQACGTYANAGVALPTGLRKTTTEWHPTWQLPARVAEPGKVSTIVYNGQPDPFAGGAVASCAPSDATLPNGAPIAVVCKRVETATTDVNGADGFSATAQSGVTPRTWQYTYNRAGQMLTEDGPRSDVSDISTYTYYADTTAEHTAGDLATATNAVQQTTTFTRYNRHGQVLEALDSNGVLTTRTYNLRLRLTSVTVGGRSITYAYEPTGELSRVTQQNGDYVEYTYDEAQRLTEVRDNVGNRISYILDNAGNRLREEVRDPNSNLTRQLERVMDALGRVQRTTGRE